MPDFKSTSSLSHTAQERPVQPAQPSEMAIKSGAPPAPGDISAERVGLRDAGKPAEAAGGGTVTGKGIRPPVPPEAAYDMTNAVNKAASRAGRPPQSGAGSP